LFLKKHVLVKYTKDIFTSSIVNLYEMDTDFSVIYKLLITFIFFKNEVQEKV